jgi:hypothetical protein
MAVYYLCPDHDVPSGGVRVIYRHVDVLRRAGLEAFVVHERRGFRCTWFDNETPVRSWSERRPRPPSDSFAARAYRRAARRARVVPGDYRYGHVTDPPCFALSDDDVVVVPEIYEPHIADIAPGKRKVVLAQSAYLLFQRQSERTPPAGFASAGPEVVGTIVVSHDSLAVLRHAFPDALILRVRPSVDPVLFAYSAEKKPLISYMPRLHSEGPRAVLAMLAARGALDGFEVVPIADRSEAEAAEILRRTLVFLNHRHLEGFGLPGAEAMACGAIVVGYHGNAGREYLLPEVAFPVATGDILSFARTLEQVLELHRSNPADLRSLGKRAADFIRETYSPELEAAELLAAWNAILDHARQRAPSDAVRR